MQATYRASQSHPKHCPSSLRPTTGAWYLVFAVARNARAVLPDIAYVVTAQGDGGHARVMRVCGGQRPSLDAFVKRELARNALNCRVVRASPPAIA